MKKLLFIAISLMLLSNCKKENSDYKSDWVCKTTVELNGGTMGSPHYFKVEDATEETIKIEHEQIESQWFPNQSSWGIIHTECQRNYWED